MSLPKAGNPLGDRSLVDQVYHTGSLFSSVSAAIEQGDWALAGFQLVDKLRTQQADNAGGTVVAKGIVIRLEAECQNLMAAHIGEV